MSVTISPTMQLQFLNPATGQPAVGFLLFTFISGTTTPQSTWTDSTQDTLNTNPIVLDSNGSATVWLDPALTYTFVYSPPNDTNPPTSAIRTVNGIQSAVTYAQGIITTSDLTELLTAQYLGSILYPQTQVEKNDSVTPTNTAFPPGYPERYISSGVIYASINGSTGTDMTIPINTAMSLVGQPAYLGPFNYLVSELVCPAGGQLIGQGRWESNLVCKPGATGIAFYATNAQKIRLTGWSMYGNISASTPTAYSYGYLAGDTTVYGTEAWMDDITFRDFGCKGVTMTCNIGEMGFIQDLNTDGVSILGSGIAINQLEVTGPLGFAANGATVCVNIGEGHVGFIEIEAPVSGAVPIYYAANTRIDYLIVSFNAGAVVPEIMTTGTNAPIVSVGQFQPYAAQGAAWNSASTYGSGALVKEGLQYYCILANVNQMPPNATYWQLSPLIQNQNIFDANAGTWCGGNFSGGSYSGNGQLFLNKGGAGGALFAGGLTVGGTGGELFTKFKFAPPMAGAFPPVTPTGGTAPATVGFPNGATLAGTTYQVALTARGTPPPAAFYYTSAGTGGFTIGNAGTYTGTVDCIVEY